MKYVDGRRNVEPANAEKYTDRSIEFPYKIDHDDLCYKVFAEHGFEWGGDWEHAKDYQHFEMPDEWIQKSSCRKMWYNIKVRAEKCNATQKFVHKSVAKYIFTVSYTHLQGVQLAEVKDKLSKIGDITDEQALKLVEQDEEVFKRCV